MYLGRKTPKKVYRKGNIKIISMLGPFLFPLTEKVRNLLSH